MSGHHRRKVLGFAARCVHGYVVNAKCARWLQMCTETEEERRGRCACVNDRPKKNILLVEAPQNTTKHHKIPQKLLTKSTSADSDPMRQKALGLISQSFTTHLLTNEVHKAMQVCGR